MITPESQGSWKQGGHTFEIVKDDERRYRKMDALATSRKFRLFCDGKAPPREWFHSMKAAVDYVQTFVRELNGLPPKEIVPGVSVKIEQAERALERDFAAVRRRLNLKIEPERVEPTPELLANKEWGVF
ncbi:hypothetical protein SAMN05216548_11444 [Faunimonas pinastri]|uniref:PH domain-containing protein n=1 Tax=Faunimonas pinastri TaxID=1855383 RepID=A0A1H9MTL1_9HYPH|nr:hypothetical protein [Faunimonas pinastri]SER27022.1 hypothetical protein SAMN05216548_11444 [Faunimonas pinastri]